MLPVRLNKIISTALFVLGFLCVTYTQTTIINASNATGTSGANGGFENATNTFAANGWTVVNGATNKWFTGTNAFCAGTKGAYVGTAAGNNNYTISSADVSHFYKDVSFPSGQGCITLTFNYKGQGESGYDGIRVSIGSTAVAPVAATLFTTSDPSAIQLGNAFYNLQSGCTSVSLTLPSSFAGTSKRLVFSWINDGSIGTTPAGSIDGVSLISNTTTAPTCATALIPSNLSTSVSTCNGLSWTAPVSTGCNNATSYDVYFGTSATPPFVTNTTNVFYATPMNFNTTYYWQIIPKNSSGNASGCGIQSFTTGNSTNLNYNLMDDATSAAPYNCVTLTPNLTSQRGCAWDANSTLNFLSNFSYEIDVNLGSDNAGADGMAFVIQNDPLARCKCGSVGGALGAGGISNSVTIEIDTYINYEDRDDFVSPFLGCTGTEDPDHLDIWFNGVINPDLDFNCDAVGAGERTATPNAVRLQSAPGVNYDIENGLTHKFRIAWNAATNTLTATVLNAALTVTYGSISSTFNPVTIFGTTSPYFGFTASTGGLTNTQSFCLPAVLLPVELSHFEANCVSGKTLVQWATESERENDFFTVEKSCDGIEFQPFQTIDGAETSNSVQHYQLIDPTPCMGTSYYRLSQTNTDGETKILGIQSAVHCAEYNEIVVFPNPATQEVQLKWDNQFMEKIRLVDATGQLLQEISTFPVQSNSIILDVSQYTAGIYFIQIDQFFGSKTIKLTIE